MMRVCCGVTNNAVLFGVWSVLSAVDYITSDSHNFLTLVQETFRLTHEFSTCSSLCIMLYLLHPTESNLPYQRKQ
jgi:hypothetical protein